jgi:hypothetical protein
MNMSRTTGRRAALHDIGGRLEMFIGRRMSERGVDWTTGLGGCNAARATRRHVMETGIASHKSGCARASAPTPHAKARTQPAREHNVQKRLMVCELYSSVIYVM